MGDFDFLSDTPTPADILRAQALALRKQNDPSALKQQADQGMLLSAAHNSGLQNMGHNMIGNSQVMSGETEPRLLGLLKTSQEGPQADLGGKTPETFKLLTQRAQVPKFASDFFGRYDTRTGKSVDAPGTGIDAMLSPEAIEQNAVLYNQTGKLPNMGRANPIIHGAILKRAAELLGTGNTLGGNQASFAADKGSQASLTKQSDAVNAFEATAMGNLNNFLATADKVPDVGIPYLNKPLRSLDEKLLGSPDMTAFNVARQVAVNEIAKVLNNPGAGGAALSDSARHEVEALIGPNATLEQIKRAAQVLVNDMHTRKGAIAAQLAEIRGRINGTPAPGSTTAPTGKRKVYNPATGTIEEK